MAAQTHRMFAVLDDRETEVEVEIKVWSWGCAAQTYGPPESCYPAEPPRPKCSPHGWSRTPSPGRTLSPA